MDSWPAILSIILVSAIMVSANPQQNETNIAEFIKSSCKVTRYPQLCVTSLSSYAGSLKPTLSDLVKAAMNVSLVEGRTVSVWAADLEKKGTTTTMSERERAALHDCIQNFNDTVEEIQKSLSDMEQLKRGNLNPQMNDMQTFMSAALTDQDSCLNGFQAAAGNISGTVKVRCRKSHS